MKYANKFYIGDDVLEYPGTKKIAKEIMRLLTIYESKSNSLATADLLKDLYENYKLEL